MESGRIPWSDNDIGKACWNLFWWSLRLQTAGVVVMEHNDSLAYHGA
jgi:hypothetical protein